MDDEPDDGYPLATITITKTLTENDVLVFVDATCPDGDDVPLIDALGMLELAKSVLLDTAVGED